MRTRFTLATLLSLLTLASHASADDEEPSPWHLSAGGGTDFPIAVGARARIEGPERLTLSTSLGVLPGLYVDAINGFVVAVGGYEASTADLVKSALQSSLVWRTHVGWRPLPEYGFSVEGGYGFVGLGGSATGAELVAGVTGRAIPTTEQGSTTTFELTSVLHMLDVEVGYSFPLAPHLELRTALGGAFTIASSTRIAPTTPPRSERVMSQFTDYAEGYLDDVYTSYVFTPVVSVGLTYLIF